MNVNLFLLGSYSILNRSPYYSQERTPQELKSAVSPHTRDMMKGEDGELEQKDQALFLFDATRDRHMTSLKKRKEVCKKLLN